MSKWDAASKIINDMRAAFAYNNQIFRKHHLEHTYDDIEALVEGVKELQLADKRYEQYMLLAYRDWAPMAFWNQHKETYTMHPGLTRELRATDINDSIPGEMLRRLPHPDPLFVFPEGIALTMNDGKPGRLIAIQVSGAIVSAPGHAKFTSTTNTKSNGLYLNAMAEVHNSNGKVVDWDYCHTSIPFSDKFTIGSIINSTRDHYTFDGHGVSEGLTDKAALEYVQHVTGIALAHLLYVVSREPEIDKARKATTAQGPQSKRLGAPVPRPAKVMPVGYRIGAALDAHRRNVDANPTKSDGTSGRTVKPHTRKAHFHTVRYGKGRALSYIDWFPPIPVKQNGPAFEPTLHGY